MTTLEAATVLEQCVAAMHKDGLTAAHIATLDDLVQRLRPHAGFTPVNRKLILVANQHRFEAYWCYEGGQTPEADEAEVQALLDAGRLCNGYPWNHPEWDATLYEVRDE